VIAAGTHAVPTLRFLDSRNVVVASPTGTRDPAADTATSFTISATISTTTVAVREGTAGAIG
jgi:hypothetical protein